MSTRGFTSSDENAEKSMVALSVPELCETTAITEPVVPIRYPRRDGNVAYKNGNV